MSSREFIEFCRDELHDYTVYMVLARREKNRERARLLERLAEQEKRHYMFWRRLAGRDCKVSKIHGLIATVLRTLFGLTFTLKLLERGEAETIEKYRRVLDKLGSEERRELESIIRDEEEHEKALLEQIDEAVVKYVGFIALGLADAIVEITGVHAGFLGATASTIMAGVAGLVVGFAAAISMASAAYIQAKQERAARSPGLSALATGLAYIFAVVLLALPYFMTHSMALAFTASVLMGVGLIAGFNYYAAVLFDRSFPREFAESVALMLGTAAATYMFGEIVGSMFGIPELLG